MRSIALLVGITLATFGLAPASAPASQAPHLAESLAAEDPVALANEALERGDPGRGALVFHRPTLTCVQCHAAGGDGGGETLGPDLARPSQGWSPAHLVESVLQPSKALREGFEPVVVARDDGSIVTGLLAEDRPDALILRDPAQGGRLIVVPKAEIEARKPGDVSVMPAGLANLLADRGEFLDLVRYLIAVAEGGPERARALRPDPALLAPPLPEYENDIDHATLISRLDAGSLARGAAIYGRVCINCHGSKDQPGSLPTAPRFATAEFKNGSDPYHLYRTLTHGFGQMAPQTWMVPRQRYDVIHYLRETFLKHDNPTKYVPITSGYLAALPKGSTLGPEPSGFEPWSAMDYGPTLTATYEVGDDGTNFAYKGVAVRLDPGPGGIARGHDWMVFDHDTLRVAAAWSGGGFIDWAGINFDGRHGVHPHVAGKVHISNPTGPGWANPADGSFDDPRPPGRDGRRYGPLPRAWGRYRGRFAHGDRVVIAYRVGDADVLELPGLEIDPAHVDAPVFTRTIEVGRSTRSLRLRIAPESAAVALRGGEGTSIAVEDGYHTLEIPAGATPVRLKLLMSSGDADALRAFARVSPAPEDLDAWTRGGPSPWPEVLATRTIVGSNGGPFAADVLTLPEVNPWLAQVRATALDFLPGGDAAAVCTWDGDVWVVEGLTEAPGTLRWRRIAAGLFQPLGLKVVDGAIYVNCRDQIAILRDLDGDGATDYYECFNSDHQVTDHFHEFAMGLQIDNAGNFYYAKAARHGLEAVVPQHGTLLRVAKDGSRTDILATGFRAPNGVCLRGDGTFYMTDQEGFWLPKNRINWVKPGGFYGNMWGFTSVTDPSDSAMEPPICWITNDFDRSPSEPLLVASKSWGPLNGQLLNFSYGYGKVYVVPHETVGDLMQGGMCALPLPQFPTGVMRGRFHPSDGHLYACGMYAWAGNQTQPGGLYRIRATGKPAYLPISLHAHPGGLAITFSDPIEPESAEAGRVAVKVWSLRRTADYGSKHYDEHPLEIAGATLSDDGRTLDLSIPEIAPTWCMEVKYRVRTAGGEDVEGVIHNTIHRLATDPATGD